MNIAVIGYESLRERKERFIAKLLENRHQVYDVLMCYISNNYNLLKADQERHKLIHESDYVYLITDGGIDDVSVGAIAIAHGENKPVYASQKPEHIFKEFIKGYLSEDEFIEMLGNPVEKARQFGLVQ